MNITPVLYNIRSLYNVGSIMRTCDGLGVKNIVTIGITPHLSQENDDRLPHVIKKAEDKIAKTALGAEKTVCTKHYASFDEFLAASINPIVALEQHKDSVNLQDFKSTQDFYLLLGEETTGLPIEVIKHCSSVIEIPMKGQKNSFNVSVAFAIAAYSLTN